MKLGKAAFVLLTFLLTLQMAASATSFDSAYRGQLIDNVKNALRVYIDPNVTSTVDARLDADRSNLVAIADPQQFAVAVTSDLRAAGHDKHLYVLYSDRLPPPDAQSHNTKAGRLHDESSTRLHNADVRGAFWLPGNVGYINLRGFPPMLGNATKAPIDAAMGIVANTDALIIDLRRNGGGDPDSLDYWMGYFFAPRTELTSIRWLRPQPHIDRQFSAAQVTGARYGKPIYILTSSSTASCAEQFAYDLQSLHRATLIGETTAGAANPGDFTRLDDHFAVFVPTGRAYNPYTKTNWEGIGIKPEVATPAGDALVKAYTLALRQANDPFDELVVERDAVLKNPGRVLSNILTTQ